jgi:uncharacterized protein YcbK (DUF882 family)
MPKLNLNDDITLHFQWSEFIRPEDPLPPDFVLKNLRKLAEQLEIFRERWGNEPIIIHSGYRSYQHNLSVGGRKHSFHLLGMAADFTHASLSPLEVQQYLSSWPGGLGSYTTFTHIDLRPYKARWKG